MGLVACYIYINSIHVAVYRCEYTDSSSWVRQITQTHNSGGGEGRTFN